MHQMRISTTQVSSVMLRSKKLEIRKQMWKLKEPKLSQIRRRIELCLGEIIIRFEMNFQILTSFPWQFYSYSYFEASTKVLSNWAVQKSFLLGKSR
jgi:hypothetical protein